jgi:hypothetical protein
MLAAVTRAATRAFRWQCTTLGGTFVEDAVCRPGRVCID